MIGMFCQARIGAWQAGQAERGVTRLYGAAAGPVFATGALAPGALVPGASSAHCSRHWRSSIFGRRWMTTLRKLPTSSPNTPASAAQAAPETSGRASTPRALDDRAELEDRQVHR